MKCKLFFFICFFLVQFIRAQQFEVEKLPSVLTISNEFVKLPNEPFMGLMGLGYDIYGLMPKYKEMYVGFNSFAAITGERSGVFAFGINAGVQKPLFQNFCQINTGVFVGGGGGAGAPDGGGLMVRPHIHLSKKITENISAHVGWSNVTFPSGAIKSNHLNFGVNVASNILFVNPVNTTDTLFSTYKSKFVRVSPTYTNFNHFRKGPVDVTKNIFYVNNGVPIGLLGAQIDFFVNPHWYTTLEMNGAVTGGVDGYMSYLIGLGYETPFLHKNIFANVRVLAGAGGGAAVDTGGGALLQYEAGLGVKLHQFQIKGLLGNTWAPNGNFACNHFEIAIGKKINLISQIPESKNTIYAQGYYLGDFDFSTYNRTYISPHLLDKNQRYYDAYFNLFGFEFEKKVGKYTSVLAGTNWAYQGSYGAYGEGWIGLVAYIPVSNDRKFFVKTYAGAAGGGGINIGNGLLTQGLVGYQQKLNNKFDFFVATGKYHPLHGNFTPWIVDVGVKLKMQQLTKSN